MRAIGANREQAAEKMKDDRLAEQVRVWREIDRQVVFEIETVAIQFRDQAITQ